MPTLAVVILPQTREGWSGPGWMGASGTSPRGRHPRLGEMLQLVLALCQRASSARDKERQSESAPSARNSCQVDILSDVHGPVGPARLTRWVGLHSRAESLAAGKARSSKVGADLFEAAWLRRAARNGTARVESAFGPDSELGSLPDIRWQQGHREPFTHFHLSTSPTAPCRPFTHALALRCHDIRYARSCGSDEPCGVTSLSSTIDNIR